jgi:uncharacterized membrane protein
MPPPRKRRGRLIAIISIVVVVVLIGGVAGALAVINNVGGGSNGAAATPTPGVPAGFQQFIGNTFSIVYPDNWMRSGDPQGVDGQDFTGPAAQTFEISIYAHTGTSDEIPLLLTTLCTALGNATVTPTTVTIGGQQWQQEDCGSGSSLHAVSEAIVYKGSLYQITYGGLVTTYANDKAQFFSVMERSFTFLT